MKHDRLVFFCFVFFRRYCLFISLCVSSRHIQNSCDSLDAVQCLSVQRSGSLRLGVAHAAVAAAAAAFASHTRRHPAAGGGGGGKKKREGIKDGDLAARVAVATHVHSVTPADLVYKQWWFIVKLIGLHANGLICLQQRTPQQFNH